MTGHRVGLLALAVALAAVVGVVALAPFASESPDGLERVAEDEGFAELAEAHALEDGPLADYQVDGVGDGAGSTVLAGLLGVGLILGLTALVAVLLRRRGAAAPAP